MGEGDTKQVWHSIGTPLAIQQIGGPKASVAKKGAHQSGPSMGTIRRGTPVIGSCHNQGQCFQVDRTNKDKLDTPTDGKLSMCTDSLDFPEQPILKKP